jgi:phytoene dehydrogenase-like protein
LTLFDYGWKLLQIGTRGLMLTGPFSAVLDQYDTVATPTNSSSTFLRQWFDYLSFALSGMDAAHTQAAAVLYMMKDLHGPNAVLDYPMGGMDALITALVSGLEKYNGRLQLNSRVDQMILVDDKNKVSCQGVVLANGQRIIARRGVVCNAPLWNMAKILSDSVPQQVDDNNATAKAVRDAVAQIQQRADEMCYSRSFMHLHLGIPKNGLPDDLECHHSVLDFSPQAVTAEQNMVIISIPTVFDPTLAPDGYHVIHAYTAACDAFDPWEKFLRTDNDDNGETGKVGHGPNSGPAKRYGASPEYQLLKEEKAEVLWRAVETVIPDVRERAKQKGSVVMVGTPLTHRRYNQRFRGTYGPANAPGQAVWDLLGSKTEIDGLLACGDTTFPGTYINCLCSSSCSFSARPLSLVGVFLSHSTIHNCHPPIGIGLPGVAASGTIAANTLTDVFKQRALLRKLRQRGVLQ